MKTTIGRYYIETGCGFDINNATITEIEDVDKFGRYIMGACVFSGSWDECIEQATEWHQEEIKPGRNKTSRRLPVGLC